ncbi:MAG: CHAT domain-containing protein, partial [Chloroflexi bacterium]|nr:CHAT domain-containing protein [Chloroflexota bacterium]
DIHVVWLDAFSETNLDNILYNTDGAFRYLHGVVSGNAQCLRETVEESLPTLGAALMDPLAGRLQLLGYDRLALIACGRLSLLPLHAAQLPDGHNLDQSLRIAYIPSSRVLDHLAHRQVPLAPRLLAIGDPPHLQPVDLGDLILPLPLPHLYLSRTEIEAIAVSFPENARTILWADQAARSATLAHIRDATYLHFACHGSFNPLRPLSSGLALDGEDWLTLGDLLAHRGLLRARLAVLAACQTAVIDFHHVPDEVVGLSTGFLYAGASAVISTLWPVEDAPTTLLLIRFYHFHLGDGLPPVVALHRAQQWLRQSTAADMALADCYERLYHESGRQSALKKALHYRDNPDEKPFAHPYYWAAFQLWGLGS